MKCPKCNFDNPNGAKFCMECGVKLENVCPKCGAKLPETAKFCLECGAKVSAVEEARKAAPSITVPKLEDVHAQLQRSMPKSLAGKIQPVTPTIEGENRILSILFGDISGSVAITERMSPEDAADLINECLKTMVDVILKYEGSINRFIGDCVLAFFGTPTTHENDPERAILAALEMREAVTRISLQIKIGINTGMVYVGAMGPDAHREAAAIGSSVNLAARLQGAATKPGQIFVGESTYRLTRRVFEFQPLSPLILRGISEPVSAYEVLSVLPKPEKLRGIEGLRAEMIGREKEFADLKECADELLAGRGQIVSIIGEAGVGKSRLVAELKAYLKKQTSEVSKTSEVCTWLEGRCVSIGESIGYWVFIDILRSYLSFSEADSPKARGEKIVDKMKALFPQRWEEIVPYIGNLLSVKFGNQWDDKVKYMPPEQVKYQTFLTLRDVFLTLAHQKPLLLILEDLHWADNLSLDLLSLLMDAITLAPLMLLCVYRPEKEHKVGHIGTIASGKCLDRYTEITLRPLRPQESRRLVESLLWIDNLPEIVKETILQKAEGNPFFVEEVIRSLIDSGVVYQDEERWVAKAEVEKIAVPDTIQNVIMARIDRLEEEVRYVLQSAAVIGRLFRHKLLEYTTQQERNLDRYLWQLEEQDLVYEERAIPELEYSFKHALTQETAYNTILSRRRREFHRKVGEGYEALYSARVEEYYEDLAYHYSRSDALEKAVEYLIKAGDKSRKAFANHQAIGYYNEAMEKLNGLSDEQEREIWKGKVLEGLGEVYYNLGEGSKAVENLQEAIPFAIKRRETLYRIAELHFWLSDILYLFMKRFDDAIKWAESGLAVLGENLTCPQAALLFHVLGCAYYAKGNRAKGNEYLSKNKAMIEANQLGYFDKIYIVYLGIGIWEENRNIDSALMWMRNCAELCEKNRNDAGVAEAYFYLGLTLEYDQNDIRQAAECYEKSLIVCRRIEYGKYLLFAYCGLMRTLCRLGESKKAEEWLLQGAGLAETKWHLATAHGYLSEMYLNSGNQERAKAHLEAAIEFCRETDDPSGSYYMNERARYLLRVGLFLEEALEFSQKAVQLNSNVYTIYTLAWAYLQKGDAEKAIEYSKKALEVEMSNWVVCQSLGVMEEAFAKAGKRGEFVSYCKKLKEEKGEEVQNLNLTQWYLEPKELSGLFTQTTFEDEFDEPALKSKWEWVNPKGDSSYSLSSEVIPPAPFNKGGVSWLEVRAASGSDLYWNNFDAPRLLQEISGDFAVEIKMKAASEDLPSVGGLLIGKDGQNFIRFERGTNGKDELGLSGAVGGEFEYFGRGMLTSEVVYLRLERIGDRISAYCSGDGASWLTCGEVSFPVSDPIQVGIHAIGEVGLRGGAMATATRFDYFKIFRIPE